VSKEAPLLASRQADEEKANTDQIDEGLRCGRQTFVNAIHSGVNVYAWRDIRQGDEITLEYRLNAFGDSRWECRCGSSSCPGYVIGSFFALDDEQQRLSLPYAPKFIRQEYRCRARSSFPAVRY
jgi:hypothetical protein